MDDEVGSTTPHGKKYKGKGVKYHVQKVFLVSDFLPSSGEHTLWSIIIIFA